MSCVPKIQHDHFLWRIFFLLPETCKTQHTHTHPSVTDAMIFQIYLPKNSETMAFLTQNKAKECKNLVITLVFLEKRHFFAENYENSIKLSS
jgi:hypothetical protein